MFERFLHHFVAILVMVSTVREQNILCFHYVFLIFLHALYWTLTRSDYISQNNVYKLLVIYSLLLLVYSFLLLWRFYWRLKYVSMRIPVYATLLFNINLMSHFYGYFIDLYNLNYKSLLKSSCISFALSSPVYMFIIYTWFITWLKTRIKIRCNELRKRDKTYKKHVSFAWVFLWTRVSFTRI